MDIIKQLQKLRQHHNDIVYKQTAKLRKQGDGAQRNFILLESQRNHEEFSAVITSAINAINEKL
jgi:hypothetical protein